jgi:hypothetical protein
MCSYCGLLIGTPRLEPLSSASRSCFVVWGFGFCRAGLWARPRPGALGGALVMPRKSGPGLCRTSGGRGGVAGY